MLCEKCGKNTATVHTVQVVNGVRSETHLCPACAAQGGMDMREIFKEFQTSFMLPGMLRGVMGFMPVIPAFIAQAAPAETSAPPVLGVDGQPITVKPVEKAEEEDEVTKLKRELETAIAAENFEEAARLRDKIRAMQK